MKKHKLPFVFLAISLSLSLMIPPSALAYWVWSPEAGKFVNAEGVAEGPAEEQFKYALRYVDEGKPEKAISELENLAKRYPNAKITPDALFQAAVLYEQKSDNYKAYKTYTKILESYPQSPRINEVVERTYAIGNLFLSGQKARMMGFAVMPALPKAVEVFKTITETAPYSAYGDRALFNLAMAYKKTRQYDKAMASYRRLINEYPTSELLSDAKFQLADTAFQMSIRRADRDLSNLDVAEESAERFIEEHPDSHMKAKALELVDTIVDKNAEKNYKIGVYYERENYIDSAIIYYEDVAKKYPATTWATKARERLGQLKDPEKFMRLREVEIQKRLADLESKEIAIQTQITTRQEEADTESQVIAGRERERLAKERQRLEMELDELSEFKKRSVKTRLKVIKIKEKELAEKWKNLKAKKKYYSKRMSPDLVSAFARWEESLKAEEYALQRERLEVEKLGDSWGVRTDPWIRIPFIHKKIDDIKPTLAYKDKELKKLIDEENKLSIEEEILKEEYVRTIEELESVDSNLSNLYLEKTQISKEIKASGGELYKMQQALLTQKGIVDSLGAQLKIESKENVKRTNAEIAKGEKSDEESNVPFAGVAGLVGKVITRPVQGVANVSVGAVKAGAKAVSIPVVAAKESVGWVGDMLPKFSNTRNMSPDDLKIRQKELKEKVADLKDRIHLTQTALKQERHAREIEKKSQEEEVVGPVVKALDRKEKRQLRKDIRKLSREIRVKYQDVEDRKKRKDELIEKLSTEVEEVKKSVSLFEKSKVVLKPVKGAAWLARSFVFGLPDKENEVIKNADKVQQRGLSADQVSRVTMLKEDIEYEIIMIDTRHTEILELEKQLEKKEAYAKACGLSVGGLSVVRPDYILKNNFERLGRLIAPKTREEILLNQLDRASEELNETLTELNAIDKALISKEELVRNEVPAEKAASVISEEAVKDSEKKAIDVATESEEVAVTTEVEEQVEVAKTSDGEGVAVIETVEVVETVKEVPAEDLVVRYEEEFRLYEGMKREFEEILKTYLKDQGRADLLKTWEKEEGRVNETRAQFIERRNEIEKKLSGLYHAEAEIIEEMRSLIQQKIDKIDETKGSLRFKSSAQAETLVEEKDHLKDVLGKLGERIKLLRDEENKILEPLEATTYA